MRFADWPLATKTVVVCVGLAAALALVLTTMGYLQASRGLREQAEAALHSDALLVADAIDNWHGERLGDLEILARLPAIRRVLEPDASPAAVSAAQDALDAVDSMRRELDSVGCSTQRASSSCPATAATSARPCRSGTISRSP